MKAWRCRTVRGLSIALSTIAALTGSSLAADGDVAQVLTVMVEEATAMGRVLKVVEEGRVLVLEPAEFERNRIPCSAFVRPLVARAVLLEDDAIRGELIEIVEDDEGSVGRVHFGGRALFVANEDFDGDCFEQMSGGDSRVWFFVAPDGTLVDAQRREDDELQVDRMSVGANVYRNHCASCHGEHGDEMIDPRASRLAGNARSVERVDRVLRQLIQGGTFMPAFGDELSDVEIAGVATYIRSSWGHDFAPVTAEDVDRARSQ